MKKLLLLLVMSASAYAHPPQILKAEAKVKTNQLFNIAVTIRHADTGWDHYANEWVVIANDGKEIAKRTLYHPHVNEQPFTRNLSDVSLPIDASKITIKAKCNKGHESNSYVLIDKKDQQKDLSNSSQEK
ncbi:MAG: hypothetical protein R8G33_05910 [Gammaproteobacteria bacterium]|nr:hypothetical protein [Gammaproteobacteria bacterium]